MVVGDTEVFSGDRWRSRSILLDIWSFFGDCRLGSLRLIKMQRFDDYIKGQMIAFGRIYRHRFGGVVGGRLLSFDFGFA